MDGRRIASFLQQMCRDIDKGRPLRRFRWPRAMAPLIVPAALGLSAGGAGCSREDCSDGRDNDRDGLIDCSDDDCRGFGSCLASDRIAPPANQEYGAPPMPIQTPPPVESAPPPDEDEANRIRPLYADDPVPPDLPERRLEGRALERGD